MSAFLAAELCEVRIAAKTKKELLTYSAEKLSGHPAMSGVDTAALFRELQKRERQASTGFGDEIAIPHARIAGMTDFVSFALTSTAGIPFGAADKKPVKLFFVLVGPDERIQDHIRILALLSRTLAQEGVKDLLISQQNDHDLAHHIQRELNKHIAADAPAVTASPPDPSHASLLLINVYEEDYLQQVLESLLEYGIAGATIVDSVGMGQFLSSAPLFGNFIGCMRQNRYHSKTIMAITDTHKVERLFDEIERNVGEQHKAEVVSLLALPLQSMRGSMSVL